MADCGTRDSICILRKLAKSVGEVVGRLRRREVDLHGNAQVLARSRRMLDGAGKVLIEFLRPLVQDEAQSQALPSLRLHHRRQDG